MFYLNHVLIFASQKPTTVLVQAFDFTFVVLFNMMTYWVTNNGTLASVLWYI